MAPRFLARALLSLYAVYARGGYRNSVESGGCGRARTAPQPGAIMPVIKSVCVYGGSGPGTEPVFAEAAARLGREMALQGIGLVYGGGNVGLMGTVARAVLAH